MHELALTESILGIANEEAQKAGAGRVTIIRLRVGALTDVVPDTIQFYFDALSVGTRSEGARLEIVSIPGGATCTVCGSDFPVRNYQLSCPDCGSSAMLTQGKELAVDSLEVEE